MLRVGITGGIGSGKSMVCRVISAMGYPVYVADQWARQLTNSHPHIVSAVTELFGSDIYQDGELNRKRVGQMVFANKQLLDKLNSIIHPVVGQHFEEWVHKNSAHKLVFKEAAVLFESGAHRQVNKVVAVWAPNTLRIERVCRRDGIAKEEVENRMANQMPQDELLKRSDFIIKNNEVQLLTPQVVELINNLLSI